MKSKTIVIISSLLFALFVYAAFAKLRHYSLFQYTLTLSDYTRPYASILVWLIPSSEIILAILLAIPKSRLYGLYGSFLLMTAFTFYILFMFIYKVNLPCSCGGILEHMTWKTHLYFNIVFMAIAFTGLLLQYRRTHVHNSFFAKKQDNAEHL